MGGMGMRFGRGRTWSFGYLPPMGRDRRFGDTGEAKGRRVKQAYYEYTPTKALPEHIDGTFFEEWASDCEARSKAKVTPERVLVANFLLRMWIDAELEGFWAKAWEWFENEQAIYSVQFVCEQLGLDESRLRAAFGMRFGAPKRQRIKQQEGGL